MRSLYRTNDRALGVGALAAAIGVPSSIPALAQPGVYFAVPLWFCTAAAVTGRYQWEMAARTTTEGAAWNILATFPHKPIHLP